MSDLDGIARHRAAHAGSLLHDAIRAEFGAFLGKQVGERLRGRPHLVARTPPEALASLRADLEATLERLVEQAGEIVNDLRARFAAEPHDERVEGEALAAALGQVVTDETRRLLAMCGFPGDRWPDRPGDEAEADPAPEWDVGWGPSPSLQWAWRELLNVDRARAAAPTRAPGFLLAYYLPEALSP